MSDQIPQPPGQHEVLTSPGGAPVPPGGSSGGRFGGRALVVTGIAVGGAALLGGGVWAAISFLGAGPQPAEALPDSTIGYVSIDLDPSGKQKIEGIKTLRKFEAFRDEVDLDPNADLREELFDLIQEDAGCDSLDYDDDIEPWIGKRAGFAAVDLGGDEPVPAIVVQTSSAKKAEDGVKALKDCLGGDSTGHAIKGDWLILAEDQDTADELLEATEKASLADDEDYQKWTDEVGDPGFVNLYAAPEAGPYIADLVASELGADTDLTYDDEPVAPDPATEEIEKAFEDFQGMAGTIRFAGGSVELEVAGQTGDDAVTAAIGAGDAGDDVLATLPEDTAAAYGVGFGEDWFEPVVEQLLAATGEESTIDEVVADLEAESGLALPEDAETLAGESLAIALGGNTDAEAFDSGDPSEIEAGLKVKGEPDDIEQVLDKLRPQAAEEGETLVSEEGDDGTVAIGMNESYIGTLTEDGDLGGSDTFQSVVPDADDASSVLFVNFDASDDWLDTLLRDLGAPEEIVDNVAPLSALGLSTWTEDGVSHGLLKVTTD
ncbi:DUF3352 domain-containing protein [Nocardioides speluncae]|uniref:DUF3352 domain-containing protein n=1 Tax=Nocardioides speluncae TaxID=2670337 RepID=UPI000D69186B|nr:DUF3352 domain-containing protein [Nocardioides speluncae]